jgi:iron complex transport system substrate-binding protein
MNQKAQILCVVLAASMLLGGSAWLATRHGASTTGGKNERFRDVTDMTGQRVSVPQMPTHILSLCTSATDTLVSLGAADRLVAIDEFSRIVPGSEHAVVVGKGSAISREQVTAMGIDLAFIWWYQDDAAALLEDLSVPVVRIRSGRAADLPNMIRLVGEALDRRGVADQLAGRVEAFVAKSANPPTRDARRVFLEMYGPFKTVGRNTYTNDLLELAGGINVAAEAEGTVVLSAERLIQADPDVILFIGEPSGPAELARRPGVCDLRAVRQGRVVAIDRYWLVAGPNMPVSVEKIRTAIVGEALP